MTAALVRVAFVLLTWSCVNAGDWKRGRYGARPPHMGIISEMSFEETHFNHDPAPQLSLEHLPKSFSWCELDGDNQCVASWNQHIPKYCGSCYLHATLSMIQDRLKIMKGRGQDVMLSRQTFLNCAPFTNVSGGCDGGDPIDIFRWMRDHGLPDESCMLYNATDYTKFLSPYKNVTECPDYGKCLNCMPIDTPAPGYSAEVCWPVKTPVLYSVAAFGKIEGCGPKAMMNEIKHRGPIVCSLAADAPFSYGYRGGVYQGGNSSDIDHNVEVVGWGEEDGVPYWHVRNSWGTFWGEMGFFRIARGDNLLRLEECDCWYANPTWQMETDVLRGKYGGSMYGLVKNKAADEQPVPVPTAVEGTRAADIARANLLRSAQAANSRPLRF